MHLIPLTAVGDVSSLLSPTDEKFRRMLPNKSVGTSHPLASYALQPVTSRTPRGKGNEVHSPIHKLSTDGKGRLANANFGAKQA
jgi:hypothetical protein